MRRELGDDADQLHSHQAGAVVDDVAWIRHHPLVPGDLPIYGYVDDVRTGRLVEIEAATTAGAAQA